MRGARLGNVCYTGSGVCQAVNLCCDMVSAGRGMSKWTAVN